MWFFALAIGVLIGWVARRLIAEENTALALTAIAADLREYYREEFKREEQRAADGTDDPRGQPESEPVDPANLYH
jgi:hypothetical protein